MLRQFKKYGAKARGVVTAITSVLPLAIIGGLLYAGLFVKAEAVVQRVEPSAIERRDRFYGISVAAPEVVWAAGSAGKIVRSEDGGKSWIRQVSNTEVNLQGIASWDAQNAVVVGNGGVILFTRDGGAHWEPASVPATDNPNKLVRVRIFGETAWAVGEFHALLRSDDRGATWQRVLPEEDRAWNDVTFVGQRGWLVGEFGSLMKSEDGGANWSPVAATEGEEGPSLMGIAFRDDDHGVAVGLSGTVLATSDGGTSWTRMPPFTREHLYAVMWDGDRWLAVGDKGVIARGSAAGDKWEAGRASDGDVSWRTQVVRDGDRYYLCGSNLGVLRDGVLTIAGSRASRSSSSS